VIQHIAPIPCKPWALNGLSDRLIVSHYENNYGPAVRSLNAIRARLATIDLAVNVLTLVTQIFLTGRIVRWLGVGMALALLPAMTMLGFGLLAVLPTLVVIVGFQVLRRAGNFALTRPAREVLFTVVPREDRYKAKAFIDTAVYRTGDQVGAWSYALIGGLGWGATQAAVVAVFLSAVWLANSLWLGKRQEVLAEQEIDGERIKLPAVA